MLHLFYYVFIRCVCVCMSVCVCACMYFWTAVYMLSPSFPRTTFMHFSPPPLFPLPSPSPLQVCIYFCGMFICVLAGQPWYSLQGVMLGTLALSGFFTYEVCRKLDPTLPLVSMRGGEGRGGEGKGGGAGSVIVTFARVEFHTTIHCVCQKLHFLRVIEQSAVYALTCVSVLVSCLFVPCCPPPPLPRLRAPTWWCMVQ